MKRPNSKEALRRFWTDTQVEKLIRRMEENFSRVISLDEIEATRKELIDAYDSDAYTYARNLEQRYGWFFEYEHISDLDLDISLYSTHTALVEEWVAAHNLKPRFNKGDVVRVKLPSGDFVGEICHVYEHLLTYTIPLSNNDKVIIPEEDIMQRIQ